MGDIACTKGGETWIVPLVGVVMTAGIGSRGPTRRPTRCSAGTGSARALQVVSDE